ncbi:MAG: phosphotransferase [Candidatus Dormibacteraeota bacterium]|nr:phosphotransferase [Candidatus Dormibacteraeota bacterium]
MTEAEERIRNDLAVQIKEAVRDVRPIPEGHSGFSYWIELEGRRGVLRLPPPGARIAGPADIPRQARIMAALHAQGLPVPAVMATSTEPVVDGRPFVLMEAIHGDRVEQAIDAGSNPLELASSAVDVLRRFQAVPIENTGINAEDPMPLEAEISRWTWLMDRAPSELTGQAPRLAQLLIERQPRPRPPVLVHGDYHFGNMLFEGGRVVAVVDWEIAQLGQPLLDLCCISLSHVSADSVREMYGADLNDYQWYRALTYYKYAAIFGYNLMLHRRGKRPDPSYEQRTETILGFIDQGVGVLG